MKPYKVMSDDEYRFLIVLKQVPFRLTSEQVAWLLNCRPQNIPYLVAKGHLQPLGDPPENAVKHFLREKVIELGRSPKAMAKITNAIHKQWADKNSSRRKKGGTSPNPQSSES